MKKISATYIYPVSSPPIKNGIIVIDNEGLILDIIDTKGESPPENIEYHEGIIVPGFVNTHCHIELSHLKNKLERVTGLEDFLPQIVKYRDTCDDEEILKSISEADKYMRSEGIVALGDISNNSMSFATKQQSEIYYHTFVEIYATHSSQADKKIKLAEELEKELENHKLPYSVVPHANYSVSEKLFKQIIAKQKTDTICCVHNQETASENQLFEQGNGILYDLFTSFEIDMTEFEPRNKNALQVISSYLDKEKPFLFVHNTYTNKNELKEVLNTFAETYWALCPASNLFIENKLPDASMFYRLEANVTLGTDSLASNHDLSILKEMKILTNNFAEIPFETLLKWATLNGAKALRVKDKYGSLEVGKAPGIVLIENFDFENKRLRNESRVKVLAG